MGVMQLCVQNDLEMQVKAGERQKEELDSSKGSMDAEQAEQTDAKQEVQPVRTTEVAAVL